MASLDKSPSDDVHDQQIQSGDSITGKPLLPQIPTPQPRQIPQSDSGICLTPLSQASVLSPLQTETVQECEEVWSGCTGGHTISHLSPSVGVSSSADFTHQDESTTKHEGFSAANLQQGNDTSSAAPNLQEENHLLGGRSPTSDHNASKMHVSPRAGKSSGSQSPDDFTFQTKYLVLQFLHQSTTERNFLCLSQNSLSTTSESEPRYRSYADRLRKQWQKNKSQSSPTSPHPKNKTKMAKMKGSRSSPNLKDASFFKDLPPKRKPAAKQAHPMKAARGSKKSSNLTRQSEVQTESATTFIRSVSENTENSETGTYMSDADDELDTSFDSSQQGSTTSTSFHNKLAHFHHQTFKSSLPTVQSETESVYEVPLNVAEESIVDSSPLPIMDLKANGVEQPPVWTVDQYARVTDYLEQMRETPANISPEAGAESHAEPSREHTDNEDDMINAPPAHFMAYPDQATAQSGQLQVSDQIEDGAVSGGFEPYMAGGSLEEMEGAWGGVDVNDIDQAGDDRRPDQRADRSQLRLEFNDQDTVVLIDAVHSLRQEIEEEISSFESELEEAMQSDRSWSLHGLNRSQSGSPETAEIARRLARIGDEVQHKYFDHLDRAVGRLFLDNCAGLFTYENFREAAMTALDAELNGWRQVVTVLLYSQHVALHLAQSGRRTLHRVIDYTVRLLADTAADFIIRQGGWAGISAMDSSSRSSSPEPSVTVPPSFHGADTTAETHNSTLSRRSTSAPDLHTTPLPGKFQDTTRQGHLGRCSAGREASTSRSSSTLEGVTSASAVCREGQDEKKTQVEAEQGSNEDKTETAEGVASGDSVTEADSHSLVTLNLLTGCAVSVMMIGVGVAVALSLNRG